MDERLAKLLALDGPSGFEAEVGKFLKEEFEHLSDNTRVDGLGNIIAEKRGSGKGSLLIASHMDEVGFMVQHVYPNGFIRFVPLGGWDDRILPGMEVKLLGEKEIFGVIATKPPHITSEAERNQVIKMEELFVDTGLDAKSLGDLGVAIGTPMVPASTVRQSGTLVMSKALDDRVGCYNLLRVLEAVSEPKSTLYFAATVQEEVGMRGARVLANTMRVDAALVLEATVAADQPGLPDEKRPAAMNGGAVLTVMDRSMIADRALYKKLKGLAETGGIRHQIKKPSYGGTDAGEIHLGQNGIPSAVVSVPCRYIHSAHSYMSLNDIEEAVKLVSAFVAQFEEAVITSY
jgi:putative aminopeptidase FrvX